MTDWKRNFPEREGKTFIYRHYGLTPSAVHRNPKLSLGAKALYSYLGTFINADQIKQGKLHAWPSRQRILRDLNISVNTFGKYLKELKDAELVKVEQARKTTAEGRQVYGNNLYIMQAYVAEDPENQVTLEKNTSDKTRVAESDPVNDCDSLDLNTSITNALSITTNNSKTTFSTTDSNQASPSQRQIPLSKTLCCPKETEKEDPYDFLLTHWNQTGVNPHHRLGKGTRGRIQRALNQALEDYSMDELLGTFTTYAKLYKARRCSHKYRLVEFLEKRGYEHFLEESNWDRTPPKEKISTDDFTYKRPKQDRSRFPFLDLDYEGDTPKDPPLHST